MFWCIARLLILSHFSRQWINTSRNFRLGFSFDFKRWFGIVFVFILVLDSGRCSRPAKTWFYFKIFYYETKFYRVYYIDLYCLLLSVFILVVRCKGDVLTTLVKSLSKINALFLDRVTTLCALYTINNSWL